jgi:predicted RNA-binding protein with PUA-like domain
MAPRCWLVKQEPEAYAWDQFVRDGRTAWTGVRSFPARVHLRAMEKGDWVLYYHSVSEKRIVGIARVERKAYPDPTATEGDWSAVDLVPCKSLVEPVPLEALKSDSILKTMPLLRQTRLSVSPLTDAQFKRVLKLGQTRLE